MLINNLVKIVLSPRDKKILVILFLLFLIVVLLFGIFNRAIARFMTKEGKKLDSSLAGYVKYKFVNNPQEFKKVANSKNQLILFKQMLFPVILLLVTIIGFSIFCSISSTNWTYIFKVYDDMFFELSAPTTKVFGITIWSEFPHIVKGSVAFHSDISGFVAYFLLIFSLTGLVMLICAVLKFIAREKRIRECAKTIFEVDLNINNNNN